MPNDAQYPKLTSNGVPEALEHKTEEVGRLKKDLRLKDEVIQQREIEISCLRGQVTIQFCSGQYFWNALAYSI